MPSPGTCPRCRSWVPDLPPGGLCPACVHAAGALTATADPDAPAATVTARPDPGTTAEGAADGYILHRPDPPPGYDLLDRIGAGGMGLVYQARERATGRLVAVKYLHVLTHPTARDRFRVEVQALASLKHPHIVPVFAVELEGREPYFTMEYLPGGNLARRLADGPLPPGDAARLVERLARAVAAAHAAGILHRDLKPSNILLDEDGTPKVADFGLAKWVDRDEGLTGSGSLVGTPSYMAPEQAARRHADVGPAADVYSLGATLYECLTGKPPFKGASPVETALLVVSQHPVPVRDLNPGVPKDLEAVCLKCLEKDPHDRYPSAEALAEDLDRFVRGESTTARPLPRRVRAWRRAKRNWRWAAAAAALAAAVGIGAAIRPKPVESVPADQIRADLKAGKAVTLIDEDRLRVPLDWMRGAGETAAPEGESGFWLRTRDLAVLRLLDDPGIDEYRVRVELYQHLKVADVDPQFAAVSSLDRVGLALGHVKYAGGTATIHILTTLGYSDYDPAGPPAQDRRLTLASLMLFEEPLRPLRVAQRRGKNVRLDRAGGSRAWRAIELDVRPAGVVLRSGGRAAEESAGAIDRRREEQRAAHEWEGMPAALPPWSPRQSVGLWAAGSWAAARNFVIEPLR